MQLLPPVSPDVQLFRWVLFVLRLSISVFIWFGFGLSGFMKLYRVRYFGEGSHISTNQKLENSAFSSLIG